MEDEIKLSPCPFCGWQFAFDYNDEVFRCTHCGATVPYSSNGETVNNRPIEDALRLDVAIAERRAERIENVLRDIRDTAIMGLVVRS